MQSEKTFFNAGAKKPLKQDEKISPVVKALHFVVRFDVYIGKSTRTLHSQNMYPPRYQSFVMRMRRAISH